MKKIHSKAGAPEYKLQVLTGQNTIGSRIYQTHTALSFNWSEHNRQ